MWKNTTFSISAHPQRWWNLRNYSYPGTQPTINMKKWGGIDHIGFIPMSPCPFIHRPSMILVKFDFYQPCLNDKSPLNFPDSQDRRSNARSIIWPSRPQGNSAKTPKNKGYINCYYISTVVALHTLKLSFHHCHKTQKNRKVLFLLHHLWVFVGRVQ